MVIDPRAVAQDIDLNKDSFVRGILAQDVYTQRSATLAELINEYPRVKREALLASFTTDNTTQSYIYGQLRLWLKETLVGDLKRQFTSDSDHVNDNETKTALLLDHAGQSLKEGDLAETVKLLSKVDGLVERDERDSRYSIGGQPINGFAEWLSKAKRRLVKEENIKLL